MSEATQIPNVAQLCALLETPSTSFRLDSTRVSRIARSAAHIVETVTASKLHSFFSAGRQQTMSMAILTTVAMLVAVVCRIHYASRNNTAP